MNLDDLLCVGIHDNLLFSSTIDRNKRLIPGEVLQAVIHGTQELFDELAGYGVNIRYLGGETADVGDVVRTMAVNGTMMARWPKNRLVTNDNITPGDVIVGFASSGKASYEKSYNSGIGSNGLTSARHDALEKSYATHYPESFDTSLPNEVVYIGKHKMTDPFSHPTIQDEGFNVGKLVLSPTRTYAPLMKLLLNNHFEDLHGLVHCSGGGQTKCMKYLPGNFKIIKDNLFEVPPVFNLLQEASGSDLREMYQVFNMGHRLEVFTPENKADAIIKVGQELGIQAQVVGRVEIGSQKELVLKTKGLEVIYA
jgi:phosphoribosylformylglycinamidine cyclo-ligase